LRDSAFSWMAGSSPAMTKKRKVDDARRPTTASAIRAKKILPSF
jgi:hypothetical protein